LRSFKNNSKILLLELHWLKTQLLGRVFTHMTYFSARRHMVWHSSSVMLLNMSTSKGPPRRLFSSLTKTASPSHRRSANQWFREWIQGHFGTIIKTNHLGRCSLGNRSWDRLPLVRDGCVGWICSRCRIAWWNQSWPIDKQRRTHSDTCPHNPSD